MKCNVCLELLHLYLFGWDLATGYINDFCGDSARETNVHTNEVWCRKSTLALADLQKRSVFGLFAMKDTKENSKVVAQRSCINNIQKHEEEEMERQKIKEEN